MLVRVVGGALWIAVMYTIWGPQRYYPERDMSHLLIDLGGAKSDTRKQEEEEVANHHGGQAHEKDQPPQQHPPGVHHDDAPQQPEAAVSAVSCGGHYAKTCAACTKNDGTEQGASWCNGDCIWHLDKKECVPLEKVSCGGHFADSCAQCVHGAPANNLKLWCNGDCTWDEERQQCKALPSYVHPAYHKLAGGSFQQVRTERGEKVNILLVKQPPQQREKILYEKYKNDILFLGISSFEAWPMSSPNPFSVNFSDDEYRGYFPGFLTMMHEPEKYFDVNKTKYLLMSQSDFNHQTGLDFSKHYETKRLPKKYDFVFSGTDQNVHSNCVGWASFAKNWTFMLEALEVMCSPEFNLTGVLIANKDKQGKKACWIPESCQGKMIQTSFLPNQTEFFEYTIQSHFMIVPQVYDASPRVTTQSLSLNVPLLMNRNILGGWKYINEATGEFFHDMSDFRRQLRTILERSRRGDYYHPRDWLEQHYGNEIAGLKLRQWLETEFPGRVKFPPGSRLLIPWGA